MACNCLTIRIDNRDIISATGNTLHPNNTIFVGGLYDCNYTEISQQYSGAGYHCYCVNTIVPEPICFNTSTITSLTPNEFIYADFIGFYNSKPYYSVGFGYVWFNNSTNLWVCSTILGGGTTYCTLNNGSNFLPISSQTNQWNNPGREANIYYSLTGECPSNICVYQTINGVEYNCQLTPVNYYNEKPYFNLLTSGCTDSSGDYMFWNATSSRWEITDFEEGSPVKAYNTNPGYYPTTDNTYTWVSLTPNYSIDYVYSGDCTAELCGISGYSYNISDTPLLLDNLYTTTLDFDFYYYKNDILTPVVYSSYVQTEDECTTSGDCCNNSCFTSQYCISNTGLYDDNYQEGGTYDGRSYWSGLTTDLVIYYATGQTQWCLSTTLGGLCLLSGKSPCSSDCPDLCEDYFSEGFCTTTTTIPPVNCEILNFDALFNCITTTTTSTTTTTTSTTTTTTIPPCNIAVDAVITTFTTTTTSTTTTTTTTLPPVVRPCNFMGEVTFNTINGNIICPRQ